MNTENLIRGMVNPNFDRPGVDCRRLLKVEPNFFAALKSEVLEFVERESSSNMASANHPLKSTGPYGNASVFSLYNHSGDPGDFRHNNSPFIGNKWFAKAQQYPNIDRFLRVFPEKFNFRINLLGNRSGLKPHQVYTIVPSPQRGQQVLLCRFHLPIVTNDSSYVIFRGNYHHFEAGEIYFFNNATVHTACNEGSGTRIHLVWDVVLTEEAFYNYFVGTPEETLLTRAADPTVPVLKRQPFRSYRPAFANSFYEKTNKVGIPTALLAQPINKLRGLFFKHSSLHRPSRMDIGVNALRSAVASSG